MKSEQLSNQPFTIKNTMETPMAQRKIKSIHLNRISVCHRNEALNNVSLHLKAGMLYGLLGSIEKRKLLINLISGSIKPSEGAVYINDTTNVETLTHWPSYTAQIGKENQLFSEEAEHQLNLKHKPAFENYTRTSLFNSLLKRS